MAVGCKLRRETLLLALVGLVLGVGLAPGDDFWKEKAAAQWTVEEALQVLLDSAWAHEEDVLLQPRPRPRSLPRPTQSRRWAWPRPAFGNWASYLVRWESGEPVIAAFARLEELGEHTSAQFQAPPPRRPRDRYVITVKATRLPDSGVDILEAMNGKQLLEGAQLKTSRATLAPAEVERSGVGANAAIHFFFSRTHEGKPLLTSQRETVEFQLEFRRFSLKCKFILEPQWIR